MVKLVFSLDIINSYIQYCYVSREEFIHNGEMTHISEHISFELNDKSHPHSFCDGNEIQIIPGATKTNICMIKFDRGNREWVIYHANSEIENYNISVDIDKLLVIETYIGIITYGGIKIVQSFTNNLVQNLGSDEIYFYDTINSKIYNKKYESETSNRYIIQNPRHFNIFYDIIAITKEGLVCLNPSGCIDLIVSLLSGPTKEHIIDMAQCLAMQTYYDSTMTAFCNLMNVFSIIQNQKPIPGYSVVFKYFQKNDNEYFENKIKTFQESVISQLSHVKTIAHSELAPFIGNFVVNFRNDIIAEFNILYQRFRNFPQERDIVYRKYGKHPYIQILKNIHKIYTTDYKNNNIKKLSSEIISEYLFEQRNPKELLTVYNAKSNLLLSAVRQRSKLFAPIYEIYLDTIQKGTKPKYSKNNYYPFKVFSPYIFIMEHILSIDNSF